MPGPVDILSQVQQGWFPSVDFLDNCVVPLDAYLPRHCECPSVPPGMTVNAYSDRDKGISTCPSQGGSECPHASAALTESVVPPTLVTMCAHIETIVSPGGGQRDI